MKSSGNNLGQENIRKLFVRLAVPTVTAQIITMLYNMVDRIFIGHIPEVGGLALTGVGVCMPAIMLIAAFAQLGGIGGAPKASFYLGREDPETAGRILGNCCAFLIFISVVLTVFARGFSSQILVLFGASSETLPYALDYLNIYVLGTIFVELSAGLVYFITAQGCSTVSMISVGIGAVLNIILDPIFIFVFKWGVKGAAIATVLSQCVSMLFVLSFLLGKKALLRLRLSSMRIDFRLLGSCLALGVSPWVMYATECLVSISFNRSLLLYGGNIAVGAMTIFTTVMQTAILPLNGFAQGAQPIISFNYGAGRLDRVWDTCKLLLKVSLTFSTLFWLLVLITPQLFIRLFTVDEALIAFASKMMYIFFGTLFAMGAQIACQNMFLALGNAKISLFLALLRKIILLIPLIFILPLFLPDKTVAVFLAEPISDIIAAATTTTLFLRQFIKKKL